MSKLAMLEIAAAVAWHSLSHLDTEITKGSIELATCYYAYSRNQVTTRGERQEHVDGVVPETITVYMV